MSVLSYRGIITGTAIATKDTGQLPAAGCRVPLDQSQRESRWKRHLGQIADAAAIRISAALDMPLGR
jgi:hypothetical protein